MKTIALILITLSLQGCAGAMIAFQAAGVASGVERVYTYCHQDGNCEGKR